MKKQNWFNTLNEALESENLIDLWPLGVNINYGEQQRVLVPTGKLKGKRKIEELRLITVYRSTSGMYERPVHYITN